MGELGVIRRDLWVYDPRKMYIHRLGETMTEIRETPWYTRDEAANYLRITPDTLDEWVKDGRVRRRTVKGSRSVRFHRDDLDATIAPPLTGLTFVGTEL